MNATTHFAQPTWIRSHLLELLMSVLVLALAATVVVLGVRLADNPPGPAAGTAPGGSLSVTDDGCLGPRPGQPC